MPVGQLDFVSTGDGVCARIVAGERVTRVNLGHAGWTAAMTSLQVMHRAVVQANAKRVDRQRAAKKGIKPNFHVGDFVLWSRVDARLGGNKLMARWLGSFRLAKALQYSFMIEHLVTKDKHEVYATRLKYYHDASLGVNEEIQAHAANQSITLGVETILDHRYNTRTKEHELLIKWRGLLPVENSWKPFHTINKDVLLMVQKYVAAKGNAYLCTFLDKE